MSPKISQPLLKILHIASGDLWAGAEAQLFTLLNSLQGKEKIKLYAVVLNHGELAERLSKIGIDTIILDETMHSSFSIIFHLRKILRDLKPDIIHSHRKKENILSAAASLTSGTRSVSVSTIHGAQEHTFPLWQLHRNLTNIFNFLYLRYFCTKIISVSEELAEQLAVQFPKFKIATIINGIDCKSVISQSKLHPTSYSQEFTHVGVVGRLEPVKRIDIFLEVAKCLVSRHPDKPWLFHICGDGSLKQNMIELADELNITDKVTFHGHQHYIHSHIEALDVLVICSDHEGLPMTALEAITLGTPIVAHAVGGLTSLLQGESGGMVVYNHSTETYTNTIDEILNRNTNNIIENGQTKLNRYYSSEENARKVLALYREIHQK